MASLKPLPRSKAKTAYGLISDVARAILSEPKRVDMSCFIYKQSPESGGPKCGTVGCFAGWVSILAGGSDNSGAENHARQVLGEHLNYYTGGPHDDYVFSSGDVDIVGAAGTKRYARSVVRRIRRFQKINADALKAQKLALAR